MLWALRVLPWASFFVAGAAFWGLRVRYWRLTPEEPFSDMWDFEMIAQRFLERGDLGHGDFWLMYRPPVLPLLRAALITVIGRDADLSGWRWFLAMLTFAGLCWMCFEIYKVTERRWVAFAFLAVVALSKSSIFWSLKIASEGVAEACLYFAVAVTLFAERTQRKWSFVLVGLSYAIALLARPTYVVVALLMPAVFLVQQLVRARNAKARLRTALVVPGLVCLGVAAGWSPWVARSLRLYGHVVPLTTQGPYSFMWEFGEFTATVDGEAVTTDVHRLQAEAPAKFPHDQAASQYASRLVNAWLRENWRTWLKAVVARIPAVIRDTHEGLSRVPREVLFPGSRVEALLLDKGLLSISCGVVGLLILARRFRPLTVLVVVCLGSYALGIVVLGYGRMLEPVLPMLLAGNIGWLVLAQVLIVRYLARAEPAQPR